MHRHYFLFIGHLLYSVRRDGRLYNQIIVVVVVVDIVVVIVLFYQTLKSSTFLLIVLAENIFIV